MEELEKEDSQNSGRTKQLHIVMLFNYFEHLSILVQNGYIEEGIVKQSFKTIFVGSYSVMKPYIEYKQATSRQVWFHYEWLAKKWSEEK